MFVFCMVLPMSVESRAFLGMGNQFVGWSDVGLTG